MVEARQKLMATNKPNSPTKTTPKKEDAKKQPKGKQKTTWGVSDKISKKKIDALDMSKNKERGSKKDQYIVEESDEDNQVEETKEGGWLSWFSNKVQNYTGNKKLTEEDLRPTIQTFRRHLMSKNVAEEISNNLCNSLMENLLTTKTESFTTIHSTVKTALSSSLEKLLTPTREIDILRDAMAVRNRGKPYTIVFCGINGVGKSTSLAKIAYHLKTKGNLNLLLAACDTFRSGAVEQIRTHADTIEVPLFERGYGGEPAHVAREAIKHAEQNNLEAVLIDTAGRMQNNEGLMKKLALLVSINKPDLILFVGEALCGNDGVDQLTAFNRALSDLTEDARGVDGVILTKFDTVDDKVGAALSMVYAAGKPIVFIGTGERYHNIKKLNVETVVNSLLS